MNKSIRRMMLHRTYPIWIHWLHIIFHDGMLSFQLVGSVFSFELSYDDIYTSEPTDLMNFFCLMFAISFGMRLFFYLLFLINYKNNICIVPTIPVQCSLYAWCHSGIISPNISLLHTILNDIYIKTTAALVFFPLLQRSTYPTPDPIGSCKIR